MNSSRIDNIYANLLGVLIAVYVVLFALLFVFIPYSLSTWLYIFLIVSFAIDGLVIIVECLGGKQNYEIKTDEKNLAVVITTYNSAKFLEKTIKYAKKDLPKTAIYVIDDGSTDDTVKIARKNGAIVISMGENVGKVTAIHRGIEKINKPYILLLDDDTELQKTKIPTNLLKDYDAVSFRVLPLGKNLLSQFQRHEYRKSCDVTKKFHSRSASVICISGACGLFRREAILDQTKKHSGHFSGEDLQRTLLIHRKPGSNGVVAVSEAVYTHVPENISMLYRQRIYGWWPGLWNNIKHFAFLGFGRKVRGKLRFESFYSLLLVISDPLRIIALPLLLSSATRLAIFWAVYILLELIPYIYMRERESILVLLLAPLYGLFNLFTRTVGFFVWIYRQALNIRREKIADPHYRSSQRRRMLAALVGTFTFVGLFALGATGLNGFTGIDDVSKIGLPIEDNQVAKNVNGVQDDKNYTIVADSGDGYSLIARRAIALYRNDNGGYGDPIVRLYAEDQLTRQLAENGSGVTVDEKFEVKSENIRLLLEKGQNLDDSTRIAWGKYLSD